MIPVDRNGAALDYSMVTFDIRNIAEMEWIRDNMNLDYISANTGVPLHTMFSLPKLLWIKRQKSELYDRTWKFFCFADYIAYRLGADPVMDHSLASRTMLFNIPKGEWDISLLAKTGLDGEKLPCLAPCGTPIGTVKTEYVRRFGFDSNVVIAAGGHDQVCCALGAGILSGGQAMNSMGTTDSIVCVSREFTGGRKLRSTNIPCGSYSVPGLYACHSFVLSTGSVIQWFRNNFCGSGERTSYKELDAMAEKLDAPSCLYLLPHFSGSGTPYLDSRSKGIMAGLSVETSPAEVYRAILEGVCYELKINIENMESSGVPVEMLTCIGGAAKSEFYLQLKADITGKPVLKQRVEEAGCLGAALLAGRAVGLIQDIGVVLERFTATEKTFQPDPQARSEYGDHFEKYKTIYGMAKTLFSS
jgi:xylulokinase